MGFGMFAWHLDFEGSLHRHLLLNRHNYGDHFSCICLFRRSNINFVFHKDALPGRVLRSPNTVGNIALQPIGRVDRQVYSQRC